MPRVVCLLLWGIVRLFSLLPLSVHYGLSDLMAFVIGKVGRYRRDTIYINLSRSFPELKYDELRRLCREYYRYMCDIIVESLWSVRASDRRICRLVKLANPELMDELCMRYRQVVVVTGHRGNWELIGSICGENAGRKPESFAAHPVTLVYKAAQNKTFDWLFRKMRMHQFAKFGNPGGVLESRRIIRNIVKEKEHRGVYIFIADQSPLPGEKTMTSFLNQPTFWFGGPEFVASRLNLPVVYLDMFRRERGRYEIRFIPITEAAGREEPGFVTREYSRLLEEYIRMNRHNWLWSHKRWKRRPTAEEAERYNRDIMNISLRGKNEI